MRKVAIPKPLRFLTQEQLAEVHSWFGRFTYNEMKEMVRDRFGVAISKDQLHRYYQRHATAQLHSALQPRPLTPAEMIAIENADPIPDEVNKDLLKAYCLRLAHRPNITVKELTQLFQVFTYEERRESSQDWAALEAKTLALRESRLAYLKEKRALSAPELPATNYKSP